MQAHMQTSKPPNHLITIWEQALSWTSKSILYFKSTLVWCDRIEPQIDVTCRNDSYQTSVTINQHIHAYHSISPAAFMSSNVNSKGLTLAWSICGWKLFRANIIFTCTMTLWPWRTVILDHFRVASTKFTTLWNRRRFPLLDVPLALRCALHYRVRNMSISCINPKNSTPSCIKTCLQQHLRCILYTCMYLCMHAFMHGWYVLYCIEQK